MNESFGYADSYDEDTGRYRGLRGGHRHSTLTDADAGGVPVKPEVARRQLETEQAMTAVSPAPAGGGTDDSGPQLGPEPTPPADIQPTRFHGSVSLDATRAGRDASRIADEVITHLAGLMRANVTVTLEISAEISPDVQAWIERPSRAPRLRDDAATDVGFRRRVGVGGDLVRDGAGRGDPSEVDGMLPRTGPWGLEGYRCH